MDESERSRKLDEFKAQVETLTAEELLALSTVLARDAKNLREERAIVAARLARLHAQKE